MNTFATPSLPTQIPRERPPRKHRLLLAVLGVLIFVLLILGIGLYAWQQQYREKALDTTLIPALPDALADLTPELGPDRIAAIVEERLSLHGIDQDHDGLSNSAELLIYQTDPTRYDSDFDGVTDSDEAESGEVGLENVQRARTAYWQTDFALRTETRAASERDQSRIADSGFARMLLSLYYKEHQSYPAGTSLAEVWDDLEAGVDAPVDPLNQDPYVYTYVSTANGQSFTLTYATELDHTRYQIVDSEGELGTISSESIAQASALQSLAQWLKRTVAIAHAQSGMQTATTNDGFLLGISGSNTSYWLSWIPQKTRAQIISDFLLAASTQQPPGTCDAERCYGINSTLHIALGQSGALTVSLNVNGQDRIDIPTGTAANLTWTSNAQSCIAGGSGWSGAKPASGSFSTGNLTSSQTYTLSCTRPRTPTDCTVANATFHSTHRLQANNPSMAGDHTPPRNGVNVPAGSYLLEYAGGAWSPWASDAENIHSGPDWAGYANIQYLQNGALQRTTVGAPQLPFFASASQAEAAARSKVTRINVDAASGSNLYFYIADQPIDDNRSVGEGVQVRLYTCNTTTAPLETTTDSVTVTVAGSPVLPQCSDGLDNDGDTKVDCADPGCLVDPSEINGVCNPNDNNETDPAFIPGPIQETE